MIATRGAKPTEKQRCPSLFSKSGLHADESIDLDFTISKSIEDGEDVIIEGMASTPTEDLDGDIVEARAFEKTIGEYLKHPSIRREHMYAIGYAESVDISDDGTRIRARITNDAPQEPTRKMIMKGTLRGLSARFRPMPGGVKSIGKTPEGFERFRISNARLLEVTVTDAPRNSDGSFVVITDPARLILQKSLGIPDEQRKDEAMKELLVRMLKARGLQFDDTDDASILGALQKALGSSGTGDIAKALGLNEDASNESIIKSIGKALSRDGVVPKGDLEKALARVKELEIETTLQKHRDKITDGNLEFAKSLLQKDVELFNAWVAQIPAVPGAGPGDGEEPGGGGGTSIAKLTAELSKSLGLSDEDIKKYGAIKPHEISSQIFGVPMGMTEYDRAFDQSHRWEE